MESWDSCDFNYVNFLRYNKHSMQNQCLYQTTFCWHNADMHDSTDMHRNNTAGMQYNTNIRKKNHKLNNVLCKQIEI